MAISSITIFGQRIEAWDDILCELICYRLWLEIHAADLEQSFEIHPQKNETTKASPQAKNRRADFVFKHKPTDFLVKAEYKTTKGDPVKLLKDALSQLPDEEGEEDFHRFVLLRSLDKELDYDRVSKILKSHEGYANFTLDYPCKLDSKIGLLLFKDDNGRRLIIANPHREDNLLEEYCESDLALLLAIYLTRPKSDNREMKSLKSFADLYLIPLIKHGLTVGRPGSGTQEKSQIVNDTEDARSFFYDPWSFSINHYLSSQHFDSKSPSRWSKYLSTIVKKRGPSTDRSKIELMVASILPMPLSCGKAVNQQITHELAANIRKNITFSEGDNGKSYRLVSGASGCGKSTLLQYLYKNHVAQLIRAGGAALPLGIPVLIDLQKHASVLEKSEIDASEDKELWAFDILSEITGYNTRSLFQMLVKNKSGEISLESKTMRALLQKFELYLYIDAYDQISPGQKRLLRELVEQLKKSKIKIGYLLLTSRPGYDERQAFTTAISTDASYRLSQPTDHAIDDFCESWFKIVSATSQENDDDLSHLSATVFKKWLDSGDSKSQVSDSTAMAVRKSPLFLVMLLGYYLQTCKVRERASLKTRADILNLVIYDDTQVAGPFADDRDKDALYDEYQRLLDILEHASLSALLSPYRTSGRLSRSDFSIAISKQTDYEAEFNKMTELPFMFASGESITTKDYIEFVHPAFNEYLAMNGFVEQLKKLVNGEGFYVGGESYSTEQLIALRNSNDAMTTVFGTLLIGLGRDGFKYLIGEILSDRVERSVKTAFFELLEKDVGTQQYLYDGQFVDQCFDELLRFDCFEKPASSGFRSFHKLVGHKYYGENSDLELIKGIAEFVRVLIGNNNDTRIIAQRDSDIWYYLFCLDHIENRLFKTRGTGFEKLSEILADCRISFENAAEFKTWVIENWRQLTKTLPIFHKTAPVLTDYRGMKKVVQPGFNTDKLLILRAGHYWGHVGNRELYSITQGWSSDVEASGKQALIAYSSAIIYRLVALRQSLNSSFVISIFNEFVDTSGKYLPDWFHHWRKSFNFDSQDISKNSFERFVGPSQALADIANQFSCRVDVCLWLLAAESNATKRSKLLEQAKTEQQHADLFWQSARNPQSAGFLGENMLRYHVHIAGVEQRYEMAEGFVKGTKALPEIEQVQESVKSKTKTIKEKYGVYYPGAEESALQSTIVYWRTLNDKNSDN